jgi:Fic family protein
MVSVVKRKRGNHFFYYLQHKIRNQNRQKEIYLGKQIPKNIEQIKYDFLLKFYREDWLAKLNSIQKNYKKTKVRIPKSVLEKEIVEFSVRFTYNTQRIEGSTLTLRDTTDLILDGITPSNRPASDMTEAERHQKLFLKIVQDKPNMSFKTVLFWHKYLFGHTKPDIAGKILDFEVRIGGSRFVPPRSQTILILLQEFFEWYKKSQEINPVELAALVHLKFVSIHPCGDGNGRISRLMMNHVLNQFDYPMFDIEYTDRKSYYMALERSSIKNNDMIFLQWFMKRYIKAHDSFL